MAIAKKPNRKLPASAEQQASRFIEGAGREDKRQLRAPTTLRFDPDLLKRIDKAARRRGVSRSAWIQYTLSRALDEEDRE
jgi:predicted HicB family RNase H-like nuclease